MINSVGPSHPCTEVKEIQEAVSIQLPCGLSLLERQPRSIQGGRKVSLYGTYRKPTPVCLIHKCHLSRWKNLPALETTHPSLGLNCPRCCGLLPDLFMTNVCFKNGMLKAHSTLRIWSKNMRNQKSEPKSYTQPSGIGFATKKSGEFDAGGEAMLHEDKRTSSQAQAEEKSGIYGIVKTQKTTLFRDHNSIWHL